MKKRTQEEGRRLVAEFVGSGKTQRAYGEEIGLKPSVLQYWIRRVRRMEVEGGKGRFVEITLPQSGGREAMRVEFGNLRMTFPRLPDAKWLCDFVSMFAA